MTFTMHKSRVTAIRESDPEFRLTDGFVTYPRAMLHVLPDCPHNIAEAIAIASKNGWLKCVAHAYDKELTMDAMR